MLHANAPHDLVGGAPIWVVPCGSTEVAYIDVDCLDQTTVKFLARDESLVQESKTLSAELVYFTVA